MNRWPAIALREVDDARELAQARKQREQFDRNSAWLQSHIAEVYARYRGQYVCIAGEELFAGATVKGAIAQAAAAHPEDEGWFTRYIPKEKAAKVYAV
ncbi:MAG TPA: hypothetical protein VGM03_23020 [Phycisphaerae bacterium]